MKDINEHDKWIAFPDTDEPFTADGATLGKVSMISCVHMTEFKFIDKIVMPGGLECTYDCVVVRNDFNGSFTFKPVIDFEAQSLSELLVKIDLAGGLFDDACVQ